LGQRPDQLQARHDRLVEQYGGNGNIVTSQGSAGLQIDSVPTSALGDPLFSDRETAAIANQIFPNAIGLAGAGVSATSSSSSATLRGLATRTASSTDEFVTVGRVVGSEELSLMQSTGRVQLSRSGRTHVSFPANSAVNGGSNGTFVRFDVPASSIVQTSDGVAAFRATGIHARLRARQGLPPQPLPQFTNLVVDP